MKKQSAWLFGVGALIMLTASVGALALNLTRHSHEREQATLLAQEVDRGPTVQVATVQQGPPERQVVLPGDARAFLATTVYAKTSGYVKELRVDKGDAVKKGQLLAIVSSPEVDSDVAFAQTDVALREKLDTRAELLSKSGVVAEQDRETAEANLHSARAALDRAKSFAGYEVLHAPFDGVITARYVDPGALVPAATGSTSAALPLVDVADATKLRITLYLGQDLAAFVAVGDSVEIWQDEQPDRRFKASITRLSRALDPRTRTMLSEIWFDNRAAGIYPGTFVRVALNLKSAPRPSIPADAVFVRDGKLLVAVLDAGHVHFTPITESDSDGRHVSVASGLKDGQQVVVNLPSEVIDGAAVRVANPKDPAATAALKR